MYYYCIISSTKSKPIIDFLPSFLEYLEKKANDVESTGSDLKSSLKRFMFLSPRGKTRGPKTDPCRTPYVVKSLLTDEEKIAMRQSLNQESPI